jgi:hypothetical protein
MAWQFLVVDGADVEQLFLLPERGTVRIGSSQKHAEICLHDLYVARAHCEVEVTDEDTVFVRNLRPAEGILVNKVRVEETQELTLGDVLRVGNSHLCLQPATSRAAPRPRAPAEEAAAAEAKHDAPRTLPVLPPERLPELVGHVLGRYQLDKVLSHDRHRTVFLACDRKTEQQVVLKVLSPHFPARPEELQHFGEVMRKALALRHEALVTLHAVARTGPYTWLAREHVPGESLASVLQRIAGKPTKVKWQSGLLLLVQMVGVLDYLHGHHLMHGQLTPHDILVNSETEEPRLANLMLDQALAGSPLHREFQDDRRQRDVAYFSPERCTLGAFVDELSDQYSLGALVYARMTGQPPFVGKTPEETAELIRTAPLRRPRVLNPAIPIEIEAVVVRMLARHQEDRYVSPAALLADLERLGAS